MTFLGSRFQVRQSPSERCFHVGSNDRVVRGIFEGQSVHVDRRFRKPIVRANNNIWTNNASAVSETVSGTSRSCRDPDACSRQYTGTPANRRSPPQLPAQRCKTAMPTASPDGRPSILSPRRASPTHAGPASTPPPRQTAPNAVPEANPRVFRERLIDGQLRSGKSDRLLGACSGGEEFFAAVFRAEVEYLGTAVGADGLTLGDVGPADRVLDEFA